MIENLSLWAEQIIVAVIIATLIEMILPNGNNKKYIKAVIGVYILFTIISPILGSKGNISFDQFDYEKYFKNTQSYQTMSDKTEETTNININTIEQVNIGNTLKDTENEIKTSEKLPSKEEKQIKEYLSEVYDVKTKNIQINKNT